MTPALRRAATSTIEMVLPPSPLSFIQSMPLLVTVQQAVIEREHHFLREAAHLRFSDAPAFPGVKARLDGLLPENRQGSWP
jgi:hypothetical protein